MTHRRTTPSSTAQGTIVLVLGQGSYFVLGYLAVVFLARELGPSSYGVYGVIMSVLVWLEQSGRHAIPSASAKLLAETSHGQAELEKSALALNLGVHAVFFVLLWCAAPWLESWFGIANGTFLFRLAAVDLPLFGIYTALQATHQGGRRFFRLGIAQVAYALAKLMGVLVIIHLGMSLQKALLVNISASIVGVVLLLAGTSLRSAGRWLVRAPLIVAIAIPLGLYSIAQLLIGSLDLWTLQTLSPATEVASIGLFVAALNIARVPAFALATVSTVLLPSVSKAIALGDKPLVKHYMSQALRFFCLLYVPICLGLMAWPEELMQWVYSGKFAGGGVLLSILLVGEGLWGIHAVLGSALIAANQARKMGLVMGVSIVPALALNMLCIFLWGSVGAAVTKILVPFVGILIFVRLLMQQYGVFWNGRSLFNIGLAGLLMFGSHALLSQDEGMFPFSLLIGIGMYVVTLVGTHELKPRDLTAFLSWQKAK